MACSTKIRNLNSKSNLGFIGNVISNDNKRLKMSEVTVLSRDLFLKNDILTLLKFGWTVNRQALIDVFAKNGIDIEEEKDLKDLADLHNTGKDKNGTVKGKDGSPMFFDVVAILASERKATEAEMYSALQQGRLVFI
jgi:hypothetical protein